jgi:prevent-host-death family protein
MPAKTIAKSATRPKAKAKPKPKPKPVKKAAAKKDVWRFDEAQAEFELVVRRALSEGPQTVSVRGKPSVVVMDAAQYRAYELHQRYPTLYDLMQSCPVGPDEFKIEPIRIKTRVRPVKL